MFVDVRPNFTAKTYGRLKTVGPAFFLPVGKQGRKCDFQVVQCACDGGYHVKRVDDMKSGRVTSCGCARAIHGKAGKPETGYKCWESMLHRCKYDDTSNRYYCNHGARGIKVCERWKEPKGRGFMNFLADMGPRPSSKHSIDRIDNNGDYCPENCRWATQKEQTNNTNRNVWVECNGIRRTIAQWAEITGINQSTLYHRVCVQKWDHVRALTEPVKKKKSSHRS